MQAYNADAIIDVLQTQTLRLPFGCLRFNDRGFATGYHAGLKRFRRFNESRVVIQVKSESTLVNKGSNLKIHANDIVPFARKRALVAAA